MQRQLGHASIQLTVDTYGKWLPLGNKTAVNRLDGVPDTQSGSEVVVKPLTGRAEASEPIETIGGPCRTRNQHSPPTLDTIR